MILQRVRRSRVSTGPFLTAEWRQLVMLNWRVNPTQLAPHVPSGTTLDTFDGAHWVSLVGFLFVDTRVLGIPIPFHRDFEEINLRFYVRRTVGEEVRRGVCFIRELVPRRAIALTARLSYNEPYRAVPMRHELRPAGASHPHSVIYGWRDGGRWHEISAEAAGAPAIATPGSHEQFITEHFWGYTRQRDGGSIEYRVIHPAWRVRQLSGSQVLGDPKITYGQAFGSILARPPDTALLADGSAIAVHLPTRF